VSILSGSTENPMPDIIDLGGAPAEAECAQLGQTINFAAVNSFEVEAYRLAIVARYGVPPEGCRLAELANDHDFGTYRTLVLRVADDAGPEAQAYADTVEPGLATWMEAGFAPPVTYQGKTAIITRSDPVELVIGALHTSRPDDDGRFALPDFEVIHGNLTRAFP
jgi:hypothetical protein